MPNNLGEFVRKARGDMSLREFAKCCDLSHTHIDSIEKGFDPRTNKPVKTSFDVLSKLARGIGVDVSELINLTIKDQGGVDIEVHCDTSRILYSQKCLERNVAIVREESTPEHEKDAVNAARLLSDPESEEGKLYIKKLAALGYKTAEDRERLLAIFELMAKTKPPSE